MKEIGKILKQTRENKKLSVAEVHKSAKIKKSYIEALENDDVSAFPAELYYKNFLKNYAKFLNLKADELLINYESAKKEQQKKEIKEQIQNTAVNQKLQKKLVITLVIGIIMSAVLIVFQFLLKKTSPLPQYLEDVKISTNSIAKKIEIPLQIIKQKLVIDTVGTTWLKIDVDNKKVFEGTVYKGEEKIFSADNSFVLKIGNVSNASVYFNDKKVDIVSGASKNNVNNITLKKAEEKTLE
jgi:transcriptional regulator with XRE-family HTH domain